MSNLLDKVFYVVGIPNKAVKNGLYDMAKEAGIPVWKSAYESNFDEYPNISWDRFSLSGNRSTMDEIREIVETGDCKLYTVSEFIEAVQKYGQGKRMVKLTSKYNAILDFETETIKVGCQTIPFTKVEEIMKVINKRKATIK